MPVRRCAIPVGLVCLVPLVAVAETPLSYNLDAVASWRTAVAEAQVTGRQVGIMSVGDSIPTRRDSWVYWIRNRLADLYGYGGEGMLDAHWISGGDGSGGHLPPGYWAGGWGQPSSWTHVLDSGYPEHIHSITGNWSVCLHEGGGWRQSFKASTAVLCYIAEAGAGRVTVRIDGVDQTIIDADNGGAPITETLELDLPDGGYHQLELESIETEDAPKPTRFDLIDVRSDEPGSVIHRLGQGGKPISYFLAKDPVMYASIIEAIEPELVWIQCHPAGESLDQYEVDIRAYIDRVRASAPEAPIVLISHHHFGEHLVDETERLYLIATDTPNVAFINIYDLHQSELDVQILGYLHDDVHLSEAGGKFYEQWIVRELLGYPRTDLNIDGRTDLADLGIMIAAYGLEIGDDGFVDLADVDRDGVIGLADLGVLISAYQAQP
jgi:hypothetical protein